MIAANYNRKRCFYPMLNFNLKDLISSRVFYLLLIMAAALWLRLCCLELVPLNLDEHCDTMLGIEALNSGKAEKFLGIPVTVNNGKIPFLFNSFSLVISYFSHNPILIVRIPAVLFGILTVYLTYLLGARLYNNRTGILSALFLAFLPWHIIMSRVGQKTVLVPFAGILIFYFLYAGIIKKKKALFLLSFAALGLGSLYTYPSAFVFIPVFIAVFFILKAGKEWPGRNFIFVGILLFMVWVLPYVVLSPKADFFKAQCYHSIFANNNFHNGVGFYHDVFRNFAANIKEAFHLLFDSRSPEGLFAPSMACPLLLSKYFLWLLIFSSAYACYKHKKSDFVMLAWMLLSFILVTLFVKDGMCARYLFVILPVPIVLTARFLTDMCGYSGNFRNIILKSAIITISLAVSLSIIFYSIKISAWYFKKAPGNREEWIINSFGSKEAARYLFEDNATADYKVFTDFRMTVLPYLDYYIKLSWEKRGIFGNPYAHFKTMDGPRNITKDSMWDIEKKNLEEGNTIYYILWSPDATRHIKDGWGIEFSKFFNIFKELHPHEKAVKKIYYPDGTTAMEIFKVSPGKES